LHVWKKELIGDPDCAFLSDGIEHGFRISDITHVNEVKNVECSNHPSALLHSKLVDKEFKHQLQLGNYVPAKCKPSVVSPLGAILKEGGNEVRIIHDGSRPIGDAMNDYTKSLHSTHYQTLDEAYTLAKPNTYLAKVDLKSAYRSVPIRPIDYCLTGVKWIFSGDTSPTYLFDTRLPFGCSQGPNVFQRLSQAVRRFMARRGYCKLVVYLDDFFIVADTFDECRVAQNVLISLLISLGFLVSWTKVYGPSQILPFLGVVINTKLCTLSLDDSKLEKLYCKLEAFYVKKRANKRQLQSLAGLLNWACQAIRGGRYFLRRILDSINSLNQRSHKCRLSNEFRKDVRWWLAFLKRFNGTVYYRICNQTTVHTDACNVGAGMFCGGDWEYVNWQQDMPIANKLHINYKEVMAVVWAAHKWASKWVNLDVIVVTDSTVAKAIINKGTCRNKFVMGALRQVFWLSAKFNFKLRAIHVPGCINNIPDAISRLHEVGQVLRLHSLLSNWYHGYHNMTQWDNPMSSRALQVIMPHLQQWHYRLH
jgi:hypothetical protein